jgi:hypothetical protein
MLKDYGQIWLWVCSKWAYKGREGDGEEAASPFMFNMENGIYRIIKLNSTVRGADVDDSVVRAMGRMQEFVSKVYMNYIK